ncbi:uncharacterized protein B0H18DRAFT_981367 [Fomitopsis serialis]|uniref:uncharacterized protein n=1 Tax=Fomitopsis serialis TaxID=139415 RepID=UPI00200800E4|nr:uncharacterized protein B0H18DRAFT_981367 [Neoantrodia serialis]KAH9934360.1 hypothetical protein B0H18DRAFT_981367 [Neoantrodia serialis]
MCAIWRNPRDWAKPDVFVPDRSLGEEASSDGHWFPSGYGPHQCPARNFGSSNSRALQSFE